MIATIKEPHCPSTLSIDQDARIIEDLPAMKATPNTPTFIKAITVDLDGTLWDNEPVLANADCQLHDWFKAHYPLLAEKFSIENLRALRDDLADGDPRLRYDMTALRKATLRIAVEEAGYGAGVAEEAYSIFMSHRNQVELYDDVLPVLERLSTSYTLCSLTNGNADVDEVGLGHVFHISLWTSKVNAAKPGPDMFREACRRAGARPAETVHVGDEPETDIVGALAAGLKTVWINRHSRTWTHAQSPHAEIPSLWELEALLASWQSASS